MSSIRRNFIYDLINNVTGLLFPLITFPYISRILNPEGIGQVAFAQSIIAYLVMFAALGIPTYALRGVAKFRDDKEKLSTFTFEIFIIHAILSILVYGIALLFYFFDSVVEIWFIYLIASAHIVLNFLGFNWFLQGVEQFQFITIRVLIFRVISLVALFIFVRESSDIYWYMAILVFSEVGNNICNFFVLRKYISFRCVKIHWFGVMKHVKPIVNLFLLSVSTMIYFNMDNLMIGFIEDDIAVGYYNPALRIQRMLMGLVLSLSTVLFPRLSSLASTDRTQFLSLSKDGFNATLGLSLPIVFGVYALGESLILLFAGEEFIPSVLTLDYLVPVIVFGTCSNLLAKILISQDKEKLVLIATSAGAFVNLLFNAILIYNFSQYGAAIASSLSELVVLVTMILIGSYYLPRRLITKEALKYLVASVLMFLVVYSIKNLFNENAFWSCFFGVLSGVLVYVILLYLMKEKIIMGYLNRFVNIKR